MINGIGKDQDRRASAKTGAFFTTYAYEKPLLNMTAMVYNKICMGRVKRSRCQKGVGG